MCIHHRNDEDGSPRRLTMIAAAVCASLLACTREPTSAPPNQLPAPVRAADTVLFVGEPLAVVSLLRTSSGAAYTPSPTTRVLFLQAVSGTASVAAQSTALTLTNGIARAIAPGAATLVITDSSAGWAVAARIGVVTDIRPLRFLRSVCHTRDDPRGFDTQGRLTSFRAPGASVVLGELDGHPRWIGYTPTATVYLAGTQTDTTIDALRQTFVNRGFMNVRSVTTRQMVVAFTTDSSRTITVTESATGRAQFEREGKLSADSTGTGFAGLPNKFCQTVGYVLQASP